MFNVLCGNLFAWPCENRAVMIFFEWDAQHALVAALAQGNLGLVGSYVLRHEGLVVLLKSIVQGQANSRRHVHSILKVSAEHALYPDEVLVR